MLRIYGFEEIGCTPLHGEQTSGGISPRLKFNRKVTSILHGMGYMEIMNFSFLSLRQIEKLNLATGDARLDPLRVRNPLGEDSAVMRPTLAPDMLKTLSYNMNHATPEARPYEIAAVYDKHAVTEEGLPTENAHPVPWRVRRRDGFLRHARRGGSRAPVPGHRLHGGSRR